MPAWSIYFSDPVLRAPTIASMLMCGAAALVGVIVFLKKESLLGEALSHAAYPGVVIGIALIGLLFGDEELPVSTSIAILAGALSTALLGIYAIKWLQTHAHVNQDSSLCFVLSAFFGIGILMASQVQFTYSYLYKQIQVYFYGQSATMTDVHILIYGVLAFLVICAIIIFEKELKVVTFDETYAKTLGVNARLVNLIFFFLVVLSVIIGIRSVGVVLMSAMLIAPAVAARQFTNRLSVMFLLAAIFGVISAYLGTVFSVELSKSLALQFPQARLALPSGPLIVLVATFICLFSLLFAKERGILRKLWRSWKFSHECLTENLLKAMWRSGPDVVVPLSELQRTRGCSLFYLYFLISKLQREGWLSETTPGRFQLTKEGKIRAARIVRLHRLWEVYLADYLGVGAERVHKNAEEMEHIITPELEKELTLLLNDPTHDPHHQPIPPMRPIL